MSELASALHNGYTDFGPHVLDRAKVDEALVQVAGTFVDIGTANRNLTKRELDSDGIAYVGMNSNGFIENASGKEGVAVTSNLNGCTGVAAFAEMPQGKTRAMIAHYDPMSQTRYFTKQDTPVNKLLYTFRHETGKSIPMQIVVTYPEVVCHQPNFGSKQGAFDDWHYLDQIFTTAGYLGENVQVLFVPYRESEFERAVYLAAGTWKGTSGIFYNGELVDFQKRFSPGFDHAQWRQTPNPSYEHSNLEAVRTREALINNWWHLAAGEGAVATGTIQSEIVDEQLFDQLLHSDNVTGQQAEALHELATVQYSVRSNRNEYTAAADGKQYRVSVETRTGKRLDSLYAMPDGSVEAELSHTVLAVTLSWDDSSLQETNATTYYCVDNFDKKNKRLHRIDYTYKNTAETLPGGESIAYLPGLSEVIRSSNSRAAFEEFPYVANDDTCTVKSTEVRFKDVDNLNSIIPYLRYASQVSPGTA